MDFGLLCHILHNSLFVSTLHITNKRKTLLPRDATAFEILNLCSNGEEISPEE